MKTTPRDPMVVGAKLNSFMDAIEHPTAREYLNQIDLSPFTYDDLTKMVAEVRAQPKSVAKESMDALRALADVALTDSHEGAQQLWWTLDVLSPVADGALSRPDGIGERDWQALIDLIVEYVDASRRVTSTLNKVATQEARARNNPAWVSPAITVWAAWDWFHYRRLWASIRELLPPTDEQTFIEWAKLQPRDADRGLETPVFRERSGRRASG